MRYRFILISMFTSIFLACSENNEQSQVVEELVFSNYSWDSYRVSEMRGDITYSATQLPIEYYLRKNAKLTDQKKLDSLVITMQDERVIIAEFTDLSKKDVLTEDFTHRSYEEAVKYMAATIQNDYKVVTTTTKDTIVCNGVLFERNFNVAPFKRVLLFFDNIPPEEDIHLLYNDKLFSNGEFAFKFNEKPIKN